MVYGWKRDSVWYLLSAPGNHLTDIVTLAEFCNDANRFIEVTGNMELVVSTRSKIMNDTGHRFHKMLKLFPVGQFMLARLDEVQVRTKKESHAKNVLQEVVGRVQKINLFSAEGTNIEARPIPMNNQQDMARLINDVARLVSDTTERWRESVASDWQKLTDVIGRNTELLKSRVLDRAAHFFTGPLEIVCHALKYRASTTSQVKDADPLIAIASAVKEAKVLPRELGLDEVTNMIGNLIPNPLLPQLCKANHDDPIDGCHAARLPTVSHYDLIQIVAVDLR